MTQDDKELFWWGLAGAAITVALLILLLTSVSNPLIKTILAYPFIGGALYGLFRLYVARKHR